MVTSTLQHQTTSAPTYRHAANARPSPDEHGKNVIGDEFSALLAMAHGTIEQQIKTDADRATGQMFEPAQDSSGGDKMAQLTSEYRSAVGEKADQLSDARVGIEARRASLPADAENNDRFPTTHHDSKTEVVETPHQGRGSPLGNLGSGVDRTTGVHLSTQESKRLEIKTQTGRPGAKLNTIALSPVNSGQGAVSAAIASVAQGSTASATNVAERVGELLGGVRIGDAASPRASAGSQDAANPRSAPGERRARESGPSRRESSPEYADESKLARQSQRTRFDKLIGSMRLRMGEKRSTAQLRLNPPELGRIRVDVRLVGRRLVVGVQAESESARELLSRRVESLKESLKEHGIQVDRFEVMMNQGGAGSDAMFVGGDPGGATEFSRDESRLDSSSALRAIRKEVSEDHDGSQIAGTAVLGPTVAEESRLDIRI